MKLLHPEVDIVPGRPGMRPPVWPIPESQPIPGSAVVRLTNTTSQENTYIVRLRCEEPFWQDNWYTVIGMPPNPEKAENAPPPGKPDQRGPHDGWVKLYVPRGGTRDVLLRFNVPQTPESRAGRYRYTVEVETQIIGGAAGPGRRGDRVSQLPAVAIVRPFYKWDIDMSPEQPRVGIRHRATDFEIVVTNESNDWLYCDLQIPRPKDLLLETPTLRLAVPPPEPGELLTGKPGEDPRLGVQRSVPLRAATRLRMIRGEVTPQSIMLNAVRVDAPSVAPPVADPAYSGWGAVVAEETSEIQRLPGDRSINYCPPIPAKLTDFFTRSGGSLRMFVMTIIGLVVAFNMMVIMYENVWHNNVSIEPLSTRAAVGGQLPIKGDWLPGAKIMLAGEEVPVKFGIDLHRGTATVPQDLDGKKVRLSVQRFVRFLPFVKSLLPSYESKIDIQVGSPPQVITQGSAFLVLPSRILMPGELLELKGGGLAPQGKVYLGGDPVTPSKWTADTIILTIPKYAPPGPLTVAVYTPDNKPILSSGTVTVGDPMAAKRAAAQAAADKAAQAKAAQAQASAAAQTAAAAKSASAAQAAATASQQAQQNPGNQQMAAEAVKRRNEAAQASAQAATAQRLADQQAAQAASAQAAAARRTAELQAAQAAAAQRAAAQRVASQRVAAQQEAARQEAARLKAARNNTSGRTNTNGTQVATNPGNIFGGAGTVNTGDVDKITSKVKTRQGYQLSANGQYTEAAAILQEAVQLDPANQAARDGLVTTLNNAATVAVRQKNFDDAIKLRQQALAASPDDAFTKKSLALTYYNYGVNYVNNNQPKQAVDQWKQALKYAPPGDSTATDAQNMINQYSGR